MQGVCKLCGQQKELQYSHIVPAFAVRWLKETSVTGYLKSLKSKVRLQETRRVYLLCSDCEQVLSRDEKLFCEKIFIPYHEKNGQEFEYGPWLRRFIVGLHWKVVAVKEEQYPAKIEALYARAEQAWRPFLLGSTETPGIGEFHLFLSDIIKDASDELPKKINWYLSRGFDLTPIFSDTGMAGVYAMIVKTVTFSYLTPPSGETDNMVGTQISEQGVLKSPQTIQSRIGSFIVGRAKAIEKFPKTLTDRQKEKLFEKARTEPEEILRSESFRTSSADAYLKENFRRRAVAAALRRGMKGRDRNAPCPCGSGEKYKRCHGLIER